MVGAGVVWGQSQAKAEAGIAEAKADAAEAKAAATPVGELKATVALTKQKTDETAVKVDQLTTQTAAARQDIAVIQVEQKAAHANIDAKLDQMAADLKTLVKAAKK